MLKFFDSTGPEYGRRRPLPSAHRNRFPVHLFTLDPVVEEQNYQDAFSRRRELQLAMAMAVAKGNVTPPRGPFHARLRSTCSRSA